MKTGAGTRIRRLTEEDHDAVVGIWSAAGLRYRPRGRDGHVSFCHQLAQGTSVFLGAEIGKVLVGVVLGTHDGRKGWVNRLAVHPGHQRAGVGRLLVEELERRIHQMGIEMVACLVEGENPASRAFLRSIGYTVEPEISYHTKRYALRW